MRLLPSDPDIETLVGRIEKGDIDLQPDFQRGQIWSLSKRQRLIDSVLREWHIPPVHVILDDTDQKVSVLDGQQRLASIRDFVRGEFSVDGSIEPIEPGIKRLDGCKFSDLPSDVKRRFLMFPIRLFTLVDFNPTEPGELFYRLNQPSSLTAAEQRNAFFGAARKQVKALAFDVDLLGLSGRVFGFSNSRMAFDDVLARALFLLEANTLRVKATAAALADRYRSEEPFSDQTIGALNFALETMSRADTKNVVRLNKATAQSWLVFMACARVQVTAVDLSHTLSEFMSRFEFTREMTIQDESITASLNIKFRDDSSSPAFFRRAFSTYEDRATSRVADVSSVVLRDLILWIGFVTYCRDLSGVTITDPRKRSLAKLIESNAVLALSLEELAEELSWGAKL